MTIYHLSPPPRRLKTRPSSKIKASIKCGITILFALNILVILFLAPIYKRLIEAESSSLQQDAPSSVHAPLVALQRQRQQQYRAEMQTQIQPQRLKAPPPPPPPKNHPRRVSPFESNISNEVPFIGADQFNEKYASRYKALLPPSDRDEEFTIDPACGKRPDFFDFFLLPKTERSRFHEDKIIYDLFKNTTMLTSPNDETPLPKGTYVELGAFDGKEESNTIFFDKCLGWNGLLIEAQSQSYQRVIDNRPNAVKMSFSPTCQTENEVAKFYDYPLSNNGMEGLAKSYTGKETIDIPCGPLTPVLHDVFGPNGTITFFSLDVEGAELKVLETIDFNQLTVEVLMVEIQNTYCPEANCPSVHNLRRRMASTGKYSLFVDFLEASDVYVRWGTPTWRRANKIVAARKEQMQREMRERMELERRQIMG